MSKKIMGLILSITIILGLIIPNVYGETKVPTAENAGYVGITPFVTSVIDYPTGNVVVGNGQTVRIVAGGVVTGSVTVQNGGTLYLEEYGIITGSTTTGGVTVNGNGTFTMTGGEIIGNFGAVNSAGGVTLFGTSTFTMHAGEISGNTANTGGGGVRVNNGTTFIMRGGVITNNQSLAVAGTGGGVHLAANASFTMYAGEISNNTAANGGAVFLSGAGADFTMRGGIITLNTATGTGVVNVTGGSFRMYNGDIYRNRASRGAGVSVINALTIFEMFNGRITYNNANTNAGTGQYGGGVAVGNGTFIMHDGRISNNTANDTAVSAGGGVNVSGINGVFDMRGGIIANNDARNGGGINLSNGNVIIQNGQINSNIAHVNGAGVRIIGATSTFTMENGQIKGNIATGNGGGVMREPTGTFTMTGGIISDNTANNGGGLFVAHNNGLIPNLTIGTDVVFTRNIARDGRFVSNAAAANNPGIQPGVVTVPPHAFSNSDINVLSTGENEVFLITFAVRGGVGGTLIGNGITVQGAEIGEMFVSAGELINNPMANPFTDFYIAGWYINNGPRLATLGNIIAERDMHIEVLFAKYDPTPNENNNENSNKVQTSDPTNPFSYILLMILSGITAIILMRKRHKKAINN